MTMTKNQCTECGAECIADIEDGWLECLCCRSIIHLDNTPHACCCGHGRFPEDVPQDHWDDDSLESKTIHDFETVCGVSPNVEVVRERYANGGYGLQLWDNEGPLMTATRWIPGIPLGCVAIKDFDENAGCLEQLVAQGVIDPPHQYLDGYPICRLRF